MKAGSREWLALLVVVSPVTAVAIGGTSLLLALPQLSVDLGASSTEQLWIVDIYAFMVAGFVAMMGAVGDWIGHKRLLLLSATVYAGGSLIAAFSTSVGMLIASRALMGIAGAALLSATLTLVSAIFHDPHQRAVGITVRASAVLLGAAAGPVVGGILLEWFWWGAVLMVGPVMVAFLLIIGPFVLPEPPSPARRARIDVVSAGLALAAVLPTVYGLKQLARDGWSLVVGVAIVGGLVFGLVFCVRQLNLRVPLLELRWFRDRRFGAMSLIVLVGTTLLTGISLFIPIYLQSVADFTPMAAGLLLVPQSIATVASTLTLPRLAKRLRLLWVSGAGTAVAMVGCLLLALGALQAWISVLIVGSMLISMGVVWLTALGTVFIMNAAPQGLAGTASAIVSTNNTFGGALGLAVLGSIGFGLYRAQLVVPAGIPAGAVTTARETVSGANAVAQGLPAGPAAELLGSAHSAFAQGMAVVSMISAVLLIACAVLVAVVFAKRREPANARVEVVAGD
ncbi:MFS transporter [Amycolatopsis dongchuanensis]|uniref:MFS transporter, DHA2 family, multidrug resistance protein n=3 Tax=Pseudonocardiaceae TaxID=2070 RepID=A0A1I3K8V2_9PSEU|nr:MFS transporter, DHA2 family, multidrug resistance protein [Amycolatopsis sacchari]